MYHSLFLSLVFRRLQLDFAQSKRLRRFLQASVRPSVIVPHINFQMHSKSWALCQLANGLNPIRSRINNSIDRFIQWYGRKPTINSICQSWLSMAFSGAFSHLMPSVHNSICFIAHFWYVKPTKPLNIIFHSRRSIFWIISSEFQSTQLFLHQFYSEKRTFRKLQVFVCTSNESSAINPTLCSWNKHFLSTFCMHYVKMIPNFNGDICGKFP